MKKIMVLTLMALAFGATELQAQTHVNGYYKSNGTYVQPHYRSTPNSTTLDNYDTKMTSNPYHMDINQLRELVILIVNTEILCKKLNKEEIKW